MPESDFPVTYSAIEGFLRYVRNDSHVVAIRIANELLDAGMSVEQLLDSEQGLHISVVTNHAGSYGFEVSCIVRSGTDVIGDGGSWRVDLDPDRNIIHVVTNGLMHFD